MAKTDERERYLLGLLQVRPRLDVTTVAQELAVSEATVRRLFAKLESEKKVIRLHGGVQLAPCSKYDYSFRISASRREKEKEHIGTKAAELVPSGGHIFLDSGTTVLKMAEALALRMHAATLSNLVVVTNSMSHLETLAGLCQVFLTGGEMRKERRDVCGSLAERNLRIFQIEQAFLGADAVLYPQGFMTTDMDTARMNEVVLDIAAKSYVLADQEKFERSSFVCYASPDKIGTLITDEGAPAEVIRQLRKTGVEVIQAAV